MAVHLIVELGQADDLLEQVLRVDVDDLLEVIERLKEGPMVWRWEVGAGAVMRLTAAEHDTPG